MSVKFQVLTKTAHNFMMKNVKDFSLDYCNENPMYFGGADHLSFYIIKCCHINTKSSFFNDNAVSFQIECQQNGLTRHN